MIKEGIMNFYKPSGISSNDAIYMLRRVSGIKKIGHMGTLDPLAEGVLLLSIGSASKIMEYMELEFKSYECTMLLGLETDTLDTEGKILKDEREKLIFPSKAAIEAALRSFEGESMQYPPLYSSVRVNGRHLYDYARSGQEVEIKPRKILVDKLTLMATEEGERCISFSLRCSKGTYVRSLCRDIALALRSVGTMKALKRTASGPFLLKDSVTPAKLKSIAELNDAGRERELNDLLSDPDEALPYFGSASMGERDAAYFCNGNDIWLSKFEIDEKKARPAVVDVKYNYENKYKIYANIKGQKTFLGIGERNDESGRMEPVKVFYKGFYRA